MDENGCYVQIYFYDKLSSLRPSDMSDRSMRHVQDIMFVFIRRDLEYAFIQLFIFCPPPQLAVTQMTPRRSPPSSYQLARSMRMTLPVIR
jgi:hypothetical protein